MSGDAPGLRRWVGAGIVVVAAHALPVLVAWRGFAPIIDQPIPQSAILIDMAEAAAPLRPVSEQPQGAKQIESPEPKPRQRREKQVTPLPDNDPVIATSTPAQQLSEEPARVASQATAPPASSLPDAAVPTGGPATWQGLVLERLEKFKRYPRQSLYRHQQGVPEIRFVIDRNGRVLSSTLERSSGFDDLDREAAGLPKRAEPLPQPPADMSGDVIELLVPVEFFMR